MDTQDNNNKDTNQSQIQQKRKKGSYEDTYSEEALIDKIKQINNPETICRYMNDIVNHKCTRDICSKYFLPVKYTVLARVVLMYVLEINYDWKRHKYIILKPESKAEDIVIGRPPISKLKKGDGVNVNFMIDKNVYEKFCKCWDDSTGTKGEHFSLAVKEYYEKYYNV